MSSRVDITLMTNIIVMSANKTITTYDTRMSDHMFISSNGDIFNSESLQ